MVGIILASHGDFATGIYSSACMVFGEADDVIPVTFHNGETPDDLRAREICENYRIFDEHVLLYPARDFLFFQADLQSRTLTTQRVRCMKALADITAGLGHERVTIVLTQRSLMSHCMKAEDWMDAIRSYAQGDEMDPQEEKKVLSHTVRTTDTDMNHHTNNAAYIRLVCDCLPSDFWDRKQIREFDVQYVNESVEGETLDAYLDLEEDAGAVQMKRGDKTLIKSYFLLGPAVSLL